MQEEPMTTATTLHATVCPTWQHTLPCGQAHTLHKLRNPDYLPCLVQLGNLYETLSVVLDRDAGQEDVLAWMPTILMNMFNAGGDDQTPRDAVRQFLGYFIEELTSEHLQAWDLSDWESAWLQIWEGNQIPFELRRIESEKDGAMQLARLIFAELRRGETVTSSSSSTTPASTHVTPPSPSNTPLP